MPSSPSSAAFHTPSPSRRKHLNRKGSTPPSSASSAVAPFTPKRIYLIRHGESLGNIAEKHARLNDPDLIDCGLTEKGHDQARGIPGCLGQQAYRQIELVVCSPLTRALQTTCIAFPDKQVTVHYDLREFGGKAIIPENTPRKMKDVLNDLQHINIVHENLDVETHQPERWPRDHDTSPKVVRRDNIKQVFQWIGRRPEHVIAVVCHYHVIRAALEDPWNFTAGPNVHPENGIPIACELSVLNGRVQLTILPDQEGPMDMDM